MLKEKLQKVIDASALKIPSDAKSIISAATQAVADSIAQRAIPKVGDVLPEFVMADSTGKEYRSDDLLSDSQLILTVFRGGW